MISQLLQYSFLNSKQCWRFPSSGVCRACIRPRGISCTIDDRSMSEVCSLQRVFICLLRELSFETGKSKLNLLVIAMFHSYTFIEGIIHNWSDWRDFSALSSHGVIMCYFSLFLIAYSAQHLGPKFSCWKFYIKLSYHLTISKFNLIDGAFTMFLNRW